MELDSGLLAFEPDPTVPVEQQIRNEVATVCKLMGSAPPAFVYVSYKEIRPCPPTVEVAGHTVRVDVSKRVDPGYVWLPIEPPEEEA